MAISVIVFRPGGRQFFYAQWVDPVSGREAGTFFFIIRRDAERFAGTLLKQLREGTYRDPAQTTWKEFRGEAAELCRPRRGEQPEV